MVCKEAGYLGEGEDENQVEEQLQGRDPLLVGVSALRIYPRRADGLVLRSRRACRGVLDGPLQGVVGYLLPSGLAHGEVGAALELLVLGDAIDPPVVLDVGLVDRWRHDVVLATRDKQ